MAITTTLGGVTIANPKHDGDGCEMETIDIGVMHDMADGSVVYDYVTTRRRWTLRWANITASNKSDIYARYLVKTAQAFKPPNASTIYTVLVEPNSWRETYISGSNYDTRYYNCEMRLVEQS